MSKFKNKKALALSVGAIMAGVSVIGVVAACAPTKAKPAKPTEKKVEQPQTGGNESSNPGGGNTTNPTDKGSNSGGTTNANPGSGSTTTGTKQGSETGGSTNSSGGSTNNTPGVPNPDNKGSQNGGSTEGSNGSTNGKQGDQGSDPSNSSTNQGKDNSNPQNSGSEESKKQTENPKDSEQPKNDKDSVTPKETDTEKETKKDSDMGSGNGDSSEGDNKKDKLNDDQTKEKMNGQQEGEEGKAGDSSSGNVDGGANGKTQGSQQDAAPTEDTPEQKLASEKEKAKEEVNKLTNLLPEDKETFNNQINGSKQSQDINGILVKAKQKDEERKNQLTPVNFWVDDEKYFWLRLKTSKETFAEIEKDRLAFKLEKGRLEVEQLASGFGVGKTEYFVRKQVNGDIVTFDISSYLPFNKTDEKGTYQVTSVWLTKDKSKNLLSKNTKKVTIN
ncbi:hypothetical protein JM47_02670 [Ureaplasma diversum]|uniref:Protein G-related albumin-binding (GA) module domain-containing protein n=1 Tax=Ureaplasma diversum TaxID=42094 RepID=A0A0C5S243_9BACT|nr:GA module-containing protein [Ureaplasma diversum]AJQ45460.1 hypothetical protein JM47_02670 [Ureaplasma diversum]